MNLKIMSKKQIKIVIEIVHRLLNKYHNRNIKRFNWEIEDLTQQILIEVLRLNDRNRFDESKGSLETFLFNATRKVVKDLMVRATTIKRGRGYEIMAFDPTLEYYFQEKSTDGSPEDFYLALLDLDPKEALLYDRKQTA